MKKIFYNLLLIILIIIPTVAKADGDVNSNGESVTDEITIDVNMGLRISGSADYGIRISVVDEYGNRISNRTYDYWQSAFGSSIVKQMPTASYKTDIVNKNGLSYTSLANFIPYNFPYGTDDGVNIKGAGTGTWRTKHSDLEKIIKQAVNADNCVNPKFLDDNEVGFNLCEYIEHDRCEELKKIYILIEPLVRMHNSNGVYYVFSGTESVNYFPAAYLNGEISLSTYKNNYGGSVYRNLVNMYLTNLPDDSLNYQLKSGSAKYAYFTSQPTSKNVGSESSAMLDLFAGKTRDANGNVYGSSMQLVWLGDVAEKCEEPSDCCVPCSLDPTYPKCDKNNCCDYTTENDSIAIDFDIETGEFICKIATDYWDPSQGGFDIDEVCPPEEYICNPEIENCCNEPGWCDNPDNYDYCNLYCDLKNACAQITAEPEIKIDDCDEDNEDNTSIFRDPVFNSSGGQFAQYNTIEKIEDVITCPPPGQLGACYLPGDWIDKITDEFIDNSFLAIAYSEDYRYTVDLSSPYCTMYCQEIFEVTLPDNYPYAKAGMYFTWTIKDSEKDIAKASDAKLCAVDINLDMAIKDYKDLNSKAQSAASAAANLHCGSLPYYGLTDTGGEYTCGTYANDGKKIGVCCSIQCKKWATKSSTCKTANGSYVNCTEQYCAEYETESEAEERCQKELISECNKVQTNYDEYVKGYASKANGIINNVLSCNTTGETMIDMGIELNYSTLFDDYSYLTPNDIDVVDGDTINAITFACVDNKDTTAADCNYDHIFTLSDRSRNGKNLSAISCNSSTNWLETEKYPEIEIKGGNKSEYVSVYNPNFVYKVMYNGPYNVLMLNGITKFDRTTGYYNSGVTYNFKTNWNTIYLSFISDSKLYQLKEKINACACKDGDVIDATDDGTCMCTREVSYKEILEYNNYQKLEDGSLTVEFMNGTGLYPISLSYWNLGSTDESGIGHFDTLIDEDSIASSKCPGGICLYGDADPYSEDAVCNLYIVNKIMATPDDICPNCYCIPSEDPYKCCYDDEYLAAHPGYYETECPPSDVPTCIPTSINDHCCYEDGFKEQYPSLYARWCLDDTAKCYPGTTDPNCYPSSVDLVYRVVDLDNPFPGTEGGGRNPGSNWQGYTEVITNNRGVSGSELYSQTPLYSFKLTPAAIKAIREDNIELASDNNGDYLIGSVVYENGEVIGGGYSLFLHHTLVNISESYGGYSNIAIADDSRFSTIYGMEGKIGWGD